MPILQVLADTYYNNYHRTKPSFTLDISDLQDLHQNPVLSCYPVRKIIFSFLPKFS